VSTTVGLLEFWYAALRSQSGICLRIVQGDATSAKAKLYKARKDALDPKLNSLSITDSPTASDELWIVHSSKEPTRGT
jgi:hypothetical protein